MIKRPLRNLTAAWILVGATHGAIAQTPMPQTPTTKILAVGTFAPGIFCRPRFARPFYLYLGVWWISANERPLAL